MSSWFKGGFVFRHSALGTPSVIDCVTGFWKLWQLCDQTQIYDDTLTASHHHPVLDAVFIPYYRHIFWWWLDMQLDYTPKTSSKRAPNDLILFCSNLSKRNDLWDLWEIQTPRLACIDDHPIIFFYAWKYQWQSQRPALSRPRFNSICQLLWQR